MRIFQCYVFKNQVEDRINFENLLLLFNVRIASEQEQVYVIEGSPDDIDAFIEYWSE